jgi:site-specific DNA-methyltransferase (adenine-specific)
MDREWTDKALYKKYKLSKAEIEFVESMIRPMESSDE